MRVGISIGTVFDRGESAGAAKSVLAQADAAVGAGLDSLTVGDRHSTAPSTYLQNVPLIGRLLGVWGQRPVGCLFLVPLWHPVLMAEQIGTLAAMAAAPFIVQAGVGEGEALFASMGKDLRERGARTGSQTRNPSRQALRERSRQDLWTLRITHSACIESQAGTLGTCEQTA